jgi:hypothetical protein
VPVHNVRVPFTLAHSAAALLFRRLRLVPSALVIGTFAPDFEYFLRVTHGGRFGHTLVGSIVFTLPVALLVLWIFHTFVKVPVAMLLPDAIQRRLAHHLYEFRFGGAARFLLIGGSVQLGIETHLLWDSFTHAHTWLYNHWAFLRQPVLLPIVGQIPCYKIFQHGSTIVGIGILATWFMHWYRTSEPVTRPLGKSLSPTRKIAIVAVLTILAFVGAIALAVAEFGIPTSHALFKQFVGQAVVTVIALGWWLLVAYGLLSPGAKRLTEPRQL